MRSQLPRSRFGRAILGLTAGLLLVEIAIRVTELQPPTQVIRGHGVREVDGVPIWEQSTDRQNDGCPEQYPERTRVLFLGSSITFGVGVPPEGSFPHLVQRELNKRHPTPGFCVLNYAQPGFSFEQRMVVGKQAAERFRPALILWEGWVDWMDYSMIGNYAYSVTHFKLRPDGAVGIPNVPTWLNGFLFRNSRMYEYLALSKGERRQSTGDEMAREFVETRLPRLPQMAKSLGAKLVIYPASPLHVPFAETAASPPHWNAPVAAFGKANDIPVYPLQNLLINHDHLALRLDPCCHYNAAGHQALAPMMSSIILDNL